MLKDKDILALAALGAIALGSMPTQREKSYLGQADKPRGVRNNNPGNIKIGPSQWRGKIPLHKNTDGTFEQFENWYFGVRAMIRLIQNYISQGDNTIRKIVARYAPMSENQTEAYINWVAEQTGLNPNSIISPAKLYPVINAMAQMENGQAWGISRADFEKAIQL